MRTGFAHTLVLLTSLALYACAPRAARSVAAKPAAVESPEPADKPRRPPLPADVVARAALPWHGIRVEDGTLLAPEELLSELADADGLCIGEEHPNPHHHFAQLAVLDAMIEGRRMEGRELAVGFEAFQLPAQQDLDAWASGELDDAELLESTEWDERWGFDFALYEPLLRSGQRAGLPLLALNAPQEITQKIARGGLDSLTEKESDELPELVLDDAEHRSWFDAAMKHHPAPHSSLDDAYAVQVTWDETMAATAAKWLGKRRPARQLVIIAGMGHCRKSAIPARITRRTGGKILALRPLILRDDADPRGRLSGFDYGILMTTPER